MDPSRKRRVRLVVALTAALLLAGALVYTTFSAASPERIPSQLSHGAVRPELQARRARSSPARQAHAGRHDLPGADRKGPATVPVSYTGSVPDPFREGREVIVTVKRKQGDGVRRRARLARHEVPVEVHESDTQS